MRLTKICALAPTALLVLYGCNSEEPAAAPPVQAQVTKPVSSEAKHPKHSAQNNAPVLNLSKLWGASKKEVSRALRGHKLTDHESIEKDNPDKMIAGGELRAYDLGDGAEIDVSFNPQGYAVAVMVMNQTQKSGPILTFDNWRDLFQKYGLPDCGEPAKVAPQGLYWGPPHNKTGGFEIKVFADETGKVWQVQVCSPEDFFP